MKNLALIVKAFLNVFYTVKTHTSTPKLFVDMFIS